MKTNKKLKQKLIDPTEALQTILDNVAPGVRSTVPVSQSAGCVLAAPIRADRDYPPFHRSAMDGYAVRAQDVINGGVLSNIGVLPAGQAWNGRIGRGQCLRIMTGAPVPPGANAVVMVERTNIENEDQVRFLCDAKSGDNICKRGEDAKRGRIVMPKKTPINPAALATMASLGISEVDVISKPSIAVLVTGDEIVARGVAPGPEQIRDCNSVSIKSLLNILELKAASSILVSDAIAVLKRKLKNALKHDVVIIAGGVSKGDFDYVPDVLEELGANWLIRGIRMKPGKPFHFGLTSGKQSGQQTLVFGLPGNPVSVMVAMREMVLPALRRRMGYEKCAPFSIPVKLAAPVLCPKGRIHFKLAKTINTGQELMLELIPSHGSGDFISSSFAEGVAIIPSDRADYKSGEIVEYHPWS
jgi:molybdopterin molybdotransferase